ncbi:N-formylglutamate amidohydrolase [Pseudotabrizicola sediminis]|uniref:N-formylglutamate amidohydrolase n=1 Tax=Pseudotabrizicola sediminis TaxID=2486418 RepID=A0ABY2KSV4_9RHOB|nr:N-formylglutamate amidohydrolase [Pseudotabrizicola sediminis]TGD44585.1 N-formylglutamate amidohydrolase [Pseudotabrizicola sediminis]
MTEFRPEIRHEAFEILGAARRGLWLVTCDHATNRVPEWLGGTLGITSEDMARHIAYDVGARGLSVALGEALDSPVVCSDFSRLVIDPNRGEDDPTLVMKLYDGTIIPANRHVGPTQVEERLQRLYRPYHAALAQMAGGRAILAIHSFTPALKGRPPRPWHIGVLHSPEDERLSRAVITELQAVPDWCVGDNEPYSGHLPGDAIDRHALKPGRHNTLIEVRNDLIGSVVEQQDWARRLAPALTAALGAVAG